MRTKSVGEKEELKMAKPAMTDPAMQVVLVPNLNENNILIKWFASCPRTKPENDNLTIC